MLRLAAAGAAGSYHTAIKTGHPDAAVVHSFWGEALYQLSKAHHAPENALELRQAYEHLNLGEWSDAASNIVLLLLLLLLLLQ